MILLNNTIYFTHHDADSNNNSQFLFDQNVKESGQKLSFELKIVRTVVCLHGSFHIMGIDNNVQD